MTTSEFPVTSTLGSPVASQQWGTWPRGAAGGCTSWSLPPARSWPRASPDLDPWTRLLGPNPGLPACGGRGRPVPRISSPLGRFAGPQLSWHRCGLPRPGRPDLASAWWGEAGATRPWSTLARTCLRTPPGWPQVGLAAGRARWPDRAGSGEGGWWGREEESGTETGWQMRATCRGGSQEQPPPRACGRGLQPGGGGESRSGEGLGRRLRLGMPGLSRMWRNRKWLPRPWWLPGASSAHLPASPAQPPAKSRLPSEHEALCRPSQQAGSDLQVTARPGDAMGRGQHREAAQSWTRSARAQCPLLSKLAVTPRKAPS